jgi:hypothetical protein
MKLPEKYLFNIASCEVFKLSKKLCQRSFILFENLEIRCEAKGIIMMF